MQRICQRHIQLRRAVWTDADPAGQARGTVAHQAIESGNGGSFNIKQLLAAPFVVVGFAAAAKAEQPFGDQ